MSSFFISVASNLVAMKINRQKNSKFDPVITPKKVRKF